MPCARPAATQPTAKPLLAETPRVLYATGISSPSDAASSAPAAAARTCEAPTAAARAQSVCTDLTSMLAATCAGNTVHNPTPSSCLHVMWVPSQTPVPLAPMRLPALRVLQRCPAARRRRSGGQRPPPAAACRRLPVPCRLCAAACGPAAEQPAPRLPALQCPADKL